MGINFRIKKNMKKRKKIYERDNFTCQFCGWSPDEDKIPNNYSGRYTIISFEEENELQIDHIKPQAKGGSDNIKNLQTLCQYCNNKKNDKRKVGVKNGQINKKRLRLFST